MEKYKNVILEERKSTKPIYVKDSREKWSDWNPTKIKLIYKEGELVMNFSFLNILSSYELRAIAKYLEDKNKEVK